MRIIIGFTLVFFFYLKVQGQSEDTKVDNNTILWEKNYKLSWKDFTGKTPSDAFFIAVTTSEIEITRTKNNYHVDAVMVKNESWVNKEEILEETSQQILGHEKLHFDITKLFAIKLQNTLDSLKVIEKVEDRKIYDLAIDDAFFNYSEFQRIYDNETSHGMKKEEQLKWEKKIWEELNKLLAY